MSSISPNSPSMIKKIFGKDKVTIGVIHCRPLPGSPNYDGEAMAEIVESALRDGESYISGGMDGLIVENHGDIPFLKPDDIGHETSAALAIIAGQVVARIGVPVGINVLANGAIPALAVAKAAGACFIRVNQWANAYVANEGIIEGPAAQALRYRARIGARDVRIVADAHVKHGAHAIVADRPIAELVRDVEFFSADAVIATGRRTGDAAEPGEIAAMRAATRLPVLVGSGVTPDNVAGILAVADGVIVASALKHGGVWWNPVEPARVAAFMDVVRRAVGS